MFSKKGHEQCCILVDALYQKNLLNSNQPAHGNFPKDELNIIMDNCGGQSKNNVTCNLSRGIPLQSWILQESESCVPCKRSH